MTPKPIPVISSSASHSTSKLTFDSTCTLGCSFSKLNPETSQLSSETCRLTTDSISTFSPDTMEASDVQGHQIMKIPLINEPPALSVKVEGVKVEKEDVIQISSESETDLPPPRHSKNNSTCISLDAANMKSIMATDPTKCVEAAPTPGFVKQENRLQIEPQTGQLQHAQLQSNFHLQEQQNQQQQPTISPQVHQKPIERIQHQSMDRSMTITQPTRECSKCSSSITHVKPGTAAAIDTTSCYPNLTIPFSTTLTTTSNSDKQNATGNNMLPTDLVVSIGKQLGLDTFKPQQLIVTINQAPSAQVNQPTVDAAQLVGANATTLIPDMACLTVPPQKKAREPSPKHSNDKDKNTTKTGSWDTSRTQMRKVSHGRERRSSPRKRSESYTCSDSRGRSSNDQERRHSRSKEKRRDPAKQKSERCPTSEEKTRHVMTTREKMGRHSPNKTHRFPMANRKSSERSSDRRSGDESRRGDRKQKETSRTSDLYSSTKEIPMNSQESEKMPIPHKHSNNTIEPKQPFNIKQIDTEDVLLQAINHFSIQGFDALDSCNDQTQSRHANQTCPVCGRYYDTWTLDELKAHIWSKHAMTYACYRCFACGQDFIKSSKLRKHVSNKHEMEIDIDLMDLLIVTTTPFRGNIPQCPRCDFQSISQSLMETHECTGVSVVKMKPQPSSLKDGLVRINTEGEALYYIEKSDIPDLLLHDVRQSGRCMDSIFCHFCGDLVTAAKAFSKQWDYNQHLITAHHMRCIIFRCFICGHEEPVLKDLSSHIRFDHQVIIKRVYVELLGVVVEPYDLGHVRLQCGDCGLRCLRNRDMRAHKCGRLRMSVARFEEVIGREKEAGRREVGKAELERSREAGRDEIVEKRKEVKGRDGLERKEIEKRGEVERRDKVIRNEEIEGNEKAWGVEVEKRDKGGRKDEVERREEVLWRSKETIEDVNRKCDVVRRAFEKKLERREEDVRRDDVERREMGRKEGMVEGQSRTNVQAGIMEKRNSSQNARKTVVHVADSNNKVSERDKRIDRYNKAVKIGSSDAQRSHSLSTAEYDGQRKTSHQKEYTQNINTSLGKGTTLGASSIYIKKEPVNVSFDNNTSPSDKISSPSNDKLANQYLEESSGVDTCSFRIINQVPVKSEKNAPNDALLHHQISSKSTTNTETARLVSSSSLTKVSRSDIQRLIDNSPFREHFDTSFAYRFELETNQRAAGKSSQQCDICQGKFSAREIVQHCKEIHSLNVSVYRCYVCGQDCYANCDDVIRHLRKHGVDLDQSAAALLENLVCPYDKIPVCDVCGFYTTSDEIMFEHDCNTCT